jgi:hypothetical protein
MRVREHTRNGFWLEGLRELVVENENEEELHSLVAIGIRHNHNIGARTGLHSGGSTGAGGDMSKAKKAVVMVEWPRMCW